MTDKTANTTTVTTIKGCGKDLYHEADMVYFDQSNPNKGFSTWKGGVGLLAPSPYGLHERCGNGIRLCMDCAKIMGLIW